MNQNKIRLLVFQATVKDMLYLINPLVVNHENGHLYEFSFKLNHRQLDDLRKQ